MSYCESDEYEKYGVQRIPAIVITDGDGTELGRVDGLVPLFQAGSLATTICERAKSFR